MKRQPKVTKHPEKKKNENLESWMDTRQLYQIGKKKSKGRENEKEWGKEQDSLGISLGQTTVGQKLTIKRNLAEKEKKIKGEEYEREDRNVQLK